MSISEIFDYAECEIKSLLLFVKSENNTVFR